MLTNELTGEIAKFLRSAENEPMYRDCVPRGLYRTAAKQLEAGNSQLAIKCLTTCLKSAENLNEFSDECFVAMATEGETVDEEFAQEDAAQVAETEHDISLLKKWIGDLT